jgi:5-oxopent-3-ene-1,2,5-tricarboxylate decarboxylase/2-hydroxyhepta-2,4-diene-1,7-dioate isomerase
VRADEAIHLPPTVPTKILCCHLNHVSRVKEFGVQLPPAPTYFHKPVSSLAAHGGSVVRPANCRYLNYEGEVAIVIGEAARNISLAEAPRHIAGYTVANDFGLHDFRDTDAGSMLRVKGADTLCPIGPGLVTGWDFSHKRIVTAVNGVVVQDGSTDEMAWDMHYLVADLARTITLLPGDVILSGTPAGSRPVAPSDEVGAQPTETEEVRSTALGGDWEHRGERRPAATTPDQLTSPAVRPRFSS